MAEGIRTDRADNFPLGTFRRTWKITLPPELCAAAAAHNSGGKVIFQVRRKVPRGKLSARSVRIPSAIVDVVVVDPDQRQSYEIVYDPSISGEQRDEQLSLEAPDFSLRLAIARRAKTELREGDVINFGFGIPDQIASMLAAEGTDERYYQTIEHGTYGGKLLTGTLFGYARNPSCMIDASIIQLGFLA